MGGARSCVSAGKRPGLALLSSTVIPLWSCAFVSAQGLVGLAGFRTIPSHAAMPAAESPSTWVFYSDGLGRSAVLTTAMVTPRPSRAPV